MSDDGYNPYFDLDKDSSPAYAELSSPVSLYRLPNSDDLPPHWTRYFTENGQEYYVNSQTNVTQWEKPTQQQPPPPKQSYSPVPKPQKDIGGSDEVYTGLLSDDLLNNGSPLAQYTTSSEQNYNNFDNNRQQYEYANMYPSGPGCLFLDDIEPLKPNKTKYTDRVCVSPSSWIKELFWFILAFGLLIFGLVGVFMREDGDDRTDSMQLVYAQIALILCGCMAFCIPIFLSVTVWTVDTTVFDEDEDTCSSTSSKERSFALSFECLHKNKKKWSYRNDLRTLMKGYEDAVPNLLIEFESYDYTGVGKTTKTILKKTITIPIDRYRDVSPTIDSSIAAVSSGGIICDVELTEAYTLPHEQREAIDFIKKKMIQKWAGSAKYFKITEIFSLSSPPGPDHVVLEKKLKVNQLHEKSHIFHYLCCFNPVSTFFIFLVIFFHLPHYCCFKFSSNTKYQHKVTKAIQLGPLPQELNLL